MNFIEEFYYGNINPQARSSDQNPKTRTKGEQNTKEIRKNDPALPFGGVGSSFLRS